MKHTIKNFFRIFNDSYSYLNDDNFFNVDPNIIRYFRTEYGSEWKNALSQYLYKKNEKNDKKAA